MAKAKVYVVARASSGRPTLQHQCPDHVASYTSCGLKIDDWSRAYMSKPIEQILCMKARCRQ